MNASPLNGTELDLHRLATPFTQTRVQRPQQVRRLMASIDADGQRVPLVVVGEGDRFVLIDGYQRWAALTRLGRDTAQVEVWDAPLSAALVQVLVRHQGRAFEPIEQAWLLAAALAEGLSQRALAAAVGKDPSWVSRRLALLTQLSEPLQEAVRQGVLSTWAASRVFVPLARANAADAEALLAAVGTAPLSTRELATWYAHYGTANRTARTRMVAQPQLFIHALAAPDTPVTANDPEALWLAELQRLCRQLQRLARTLPPLLDPRPPATTWQALRTAVAKTAQALERLRQPFQEGEHVVRTATPDDPRTAHQGDGRAPDQPHPGAHAPHGTPGAGAGRSATPAQQAASRELARSHLDAAHALLRDPGQRGADAGIAA
jgi:ParB family transcriptional regulator, chromosome partitioning protein